MQKNVSIAHLKKDVTKKERYKIEAKNAELKNNHDYGNTNACGKAGITIQGATTFFLINMKRIIKLNEEKNKNM